MVIPWFLDKFYVFFTRGVESQFYKRSYKPLLKEAFGAKNNTDSPSFWKSPELHLPEESWAPFTKDVLVKMIQIPLFFVRVLSHFYQMTYGVTFTRCVQK